MDIETYSKLSLRTAPEGYTHRDNVIHAALGIGGEAGEVLDHVLSVNISKLEARYPDLKFDAERCLNRDLAAEKAAMESV